MLPNDSKKESEHEPLGFASWTISHHGDGGADAADNSIRRSTNVTLLGYLPLLLHFGPDKLQRQRSAFTPILGCANGSSQLTQL